MKFGFEQGGKHREKPNTRGLCHIVTALTPSSHENPSLKKKVHMKILSKNLHVKDLNKKFALKMNKEVIAHFWFHRKKPKIAFDAMQADIMLYNLSYLTITNWRLISNLHVKLSRILSGHSTKIEKS